MISIILNTDNDNLIGVETQTGEFYIPWRLDNKEDFNYFNSLTVGHFNVVMGYNTWQSMGAKPLPNHANIVITKSHYCELKPLKSKYLKVFKSVRCAIPKDDDVLIIGGKTLFDKYWTTADYIYRKILKSHHASDVDGRKIYAQPINTKYYDLVSLENKRNCVFETWKRRKRKNKKL